MGDTALLSSRPAIRRIPRPPAAASAAGGRGIPGSGPVCRLGVRGGVLAGGAEAEAAMPDWRLEAAVFSSARVVPVELRCRSAVPPSFAAPRSAREGSPFAGVREVADPATDDLEGTVAACQVGVAARRAGWRCFAPRGVAFLAAQGGLPVQACWRWCGGFRRRNVLLEDGDAGAQKGVFVISSVFWAFL